MKVKVIEPRLLSPTLAYSPLRANRIGGAPSGLHIQHSEAGEVAFDALRLASVISTVESGQQVYHLILFVSGNRRPYLATANVVHYTDFPIPPSDTMLPRLRAFVAYLIEQNPALGIDRGTYDFLLGKPVRALDRDVTALTTSLGEVLSQVDRG